ncbi:hypothetical protein BEK98_43485 [Streptomyces diastatochromogenes]|uniref:Uncharacterized protein n=1 Tax=Streptomyces diastatochromogenes TaxID=42236 RepID=A0A233RW62_STRDA|nr:hypothetical protein BEK98_43485 [Streptomyces diastatochromogenes]
MSEDLTGANDTDPRSALVPDHGQLTLAPTVAGQTALWGDIVREPDGTEASRIDDGSCARRPLAGSLGASVFGTARTSRRRVARRSPRHLLSTKSRDEIVK